MKCRICGRETNRIMIRRGTGICCNTCEKIEKNDIETERALDYLWSINNAVALHSMNLWRANHYGA